MSVENPYTLRILEDLRVLDHDRERLRHVDAIDPMIFLEDLMTLAQMRRQGLEFDAENHRS